MAIFIKQITISVCLLFSMMAIGHTIYAPNDIPLLDNRFRIDPETDQATFIFNHSKESQRVVLVRPDGHKIYEHRHDDDVAWVSSRTENIVTIQKPMAGPWQAIAELDGDNRIKLLSKVNLVVNRLPLKLYDQEYITTHAALYEGNKILKNPAYLDDAKLSISLLGGAHKKMQLYQDDGKHYDQLAFDGNLTTRLFIDLPPGRYLFSIRTQNEVFIRNVNKDAVIFPTPINYKITSLGYGKDEAILTVKIDSEEIQPKSVSIEGAIKDPSNKIVSQVMMHNIDSETDSDEFSAQYKLKYNMFTFTGKAYATTKDGREIELKLPERVFELSRPYEKPDLSLSEALPTKMEPIRNLKKEKPAEKSNHWWLIFTITSGLLILIALITLFIVKRSKKKQKNAELEIDELNWEELQPTQIDIKDAK